MATSNMPVLSVLKPIPLKPLSSRPLVSVLVTNYNRVSFLPHALESVLSQTYANVEIIVADDSSTDDSCDIVERYRRDDQRIKLVRKERNEGAGAALNAAFAASCGEIICLLDSDDTYRRDKVETIVGLFIDQPNVGVVVHPTMLVDREGNPLVPGGFRTRLERGWIAERVVARGGRWSNMPGGGTCVRREVAERIFPIPEALYRRYSDGFIYTLAPLLTEVLAIDEFLYHYRIHGENTMAALAFDEALAEDQMAGIAAQVGAVNERLRAWGWGEHVLDLRRNLNYLQQEFLLSLYGTASRWRLVQEYVALSRMLWSDDLYGRKQQIARAIVYGLAIPLPASFRKRWLLWTRSEDKLRRKLWLLTRMIKRVAGFMQPASGRFV